MTPQRILYVVSRWRAPTQTFVRREVDAARAAGRDVVVLSLKRPSDLVAGDPDVVHLGWATAVPSVLVALARHPWRSAGAVGRALRGAKCATVGPNVVAVLLGVGATRRVGSVDWVHAHFAWVAASAADGFAAARRQPFSVFAHAHDVFDDQVVDRYTASKLRRAAFVAVESASIGDEVDARFGCRSTVARVGVPPSFLAPPRTDRGHTDARRVVTVGSLVPKKGHDDLLGAVARLPASVELVVAGDGPLAPELHRTAEDLGIADRVTWLGAVPEQEVGALLDTATVFCLASRPTPSGDRDGVPNVLIEAMARSVPCVSTDVSGIPDLLGEGRGVVARAGDVDALAAAIGGLLDRPDEAALVATRGHVHVAELYRTDRNWQRLEELMGAGAGSRS